MFFKRKRYLEKLIKGMSNDMVKIVTGLRRCGKSFLLFDIFCPYLLEHVTDVNHIIGLSLDERRYRKLTNPDRLLDYIVERLPKDGETVFVILDEIQLVEDFVSVLLSLMHMKGVQVYVSGSNSKFLSSDVVTEFRGRGWEIRVHPLSFSEYFEGVGGEFHPALMDYYRYGGLPQVASLESDEDKTQYLQSVYEATYLKDVIERNHLRNPEGMRTLTQVLASSIGSYTNPKRIENTFLSNEQLKMADGTITDYLHHLQDAFIINEAQRYDVKGRKYIGSDRKYYFEDLGIRNILLNFRQQENTHIMENVIYNELRIRGYSVDVGLVEIWEKNTEGKNVRKRLEVDFVVNNPPQRIYVQSALSLPDKDKVKQEQRPLENISDNFRKVIIIGDEYQPSWTNDDGILILNIRDFLINQKSL